MSRTAILARKQRRPTKTVSRGEICTPSRHSTVSSAINTHTHTTTSGAYLYRIILRSATGWPDTRLLSLPRYKRQAITPCSVINKLVTRARRTGRAGSKPLPLLVLIRVSRPCVYACTDDDNFMSRQWQPDSALADYKMYYAICHKLPRVRKHFIPVPSFSASPKVAFYSLFQSSKLSYRVRTTCSKTFWHSFFSDGSYQRPLNSVVKYTSKNYLYKYI